MKEKLFEEAERIMEMMEHIVEELDEARENEVTFALEADAAKDEMLTTHRQLTLELSILPDIAESVDPRTGRANKDWSQFLLDEKLERDPRYIQAAGKMYEMQEKVMRVRSFIVQKVEMLNMLKTQARLITALLGALSDE
jgi:hypothetical protein